MMNCKKYSVSVLAIILTFCVGVFAGCSTHAGKVAVEKSTSAAGAGMPNGIKGVHVVESTGTMEVAFSPNGGITDMIVKNIGQAKKSIEVMAYSFTSAEIAKALQEAHKRGVQVRIILDKSQETEKYSSLTYFRNAGMAVHIDNDFKIAHNKVMILDGLDVITGSFNFTKSAEQGNGENCLVIHGNAALAKEYSNYWQWRWEQTGGN